MHVSGIVVGLLPESFDGVVAALGTLPGVRVHQQDRPGHRVVVTQETGSAEQQEEGLRRIQGLPGVAFAALVYHLFDDGLDEAGAEALVQLGGRT